jgi:methylphosphotriester-DNA--protein-cysteine methyltransferase
MLARHRARRPAQTVRLVAVDPREARVAAALRSIEGHPALGDLAGAVGQSSEHLHRRFRSSVGVTAGQHPRLSRIALARRRLQVSPPGGPAGRSPARGSPRSRPHG